jgi:hypothetical protein
MNRDYISGTADNITLFTGVEVEHTPAFGLKTLFVTGLYNIDQIETIYITENCQHIFFGANHSFSPSLNLPEDVRQWEQWDNMIMYFLHKDILCSLDIPLSHAEMFLEGPMVECNNFIPQIRVPLPYAKQWNYNTMIKIDDKDFKATNPGVWSHSLHTLMDRSKFTDWSQYKNDEIVK